MIAFRFCRGAVLLLLLTACASGSGGPDAVLPLHQNRPIPRDSVYDLEDLTTEPKLLNVREALNAVQERYPGNLKNQGIGGTVILSLIIDSEGNVIRADVYESSGAPELDEAAVEAIGYGRYAPGEVEGVPVYTRVVIPVSFQVRRKH